MRSLTPLALLPALIVSAQQPALPASPTLVDIIVNQDCVIGEDAPPGVKPRHYTDRGICSVGITRFSGREETDLLLSGKRKRHSIQIREHTFLLHNPRSTPVTFILEHRVAKGWQVDSDPQPRDILKDLAVFYIAALPGQTVSLHVGQRKPPFAPPQPPPPSVP